MNKILLKISSVAFLITFLKYRLYDFYNENIEDFINNNSVVISENKLDYTRELEIAIKTLTTSDVYQSISFDLVMQVFNFFKSKNESINYTDLKNEVAIISLTQARAALTS